MEESRYYPKYIERFANRYFKVGDRVKIHFDRDWHSGVIVNRYFKLKNNNPYVMVRTDNRVSNSPTAYLGGFGLEGNATGVRILFEHEDLIGDEIFRKTWEREKTDKEKYDYDNSPF